MITVMNIKHLPGYPRVHLKPWEVYIGRRNTYAGLPGSPLANPFPEWKYGREGCIALFREQLERSMESPERTPTLVAMRREMQRLAGILAEHGRLALVCWCAPLACHGDVIKACLDSMQGS